MTDQSVKETAPDRIWMPGDLMTWGFAPELSQSYPDDIEYVRVEALEKWLKEKSESVEVLVQYTYGRGLKAGAEAAYLDVLEWLHGR